MPTERPPVIRRVAGLAALLCLMITLAGCNVELGYTSESWDSSLGGRTPETFAAACADLDGTLTVEERDGTYAPTSTCTAPNGDFLSCDWEFKLCVTECHSSEEACDELSLHMMASVPLVPRPATPAT